MKKITMDISYRGNNELVYNFHDPNTGLGGLISFRPIIPDEILMIDIYRLDKGIDIKVSDKRE